MEKKSNPFDALKESMLDKAADWQQQVFESLIIESEKYLATYALEAKNQNSLAEFRKWLWSDNCMKEIFNSKQNGLVWQALSAAVLSAREVIQNDFFGDEDDDEALLEWVNQTLERD